MHRIGIDYTPAYEQGGGIGRLVRDLIQALTRVDVDNDYRLFVAGWRDDKTPLSSNFSWHGTRLSPTMLARLWHRLHIPLPITQFTGKIDLYHATDFVLPPTPKSIKTLVTVHDLSFIHVPEAASPNLRAYLNRVVPKSIAQASHVIADSEATKYDIINAYGTSADKITVLLSGLDERYVRVEDGERISSIRAKYGIGDEPYYFAIGTVQPRKNYSRIIQSLYRIRQTHPTMQLVIAGGKGWLDDDMYQTIDRLALRNAVKLIGFADEDDLAGLYSGAVGVVFPSLYEGFGFPVLEGMACGTPVITANVSSLPEVAGDAAILVDPYSVDDITQAMLNILEDNALRSRLIARGYQQAKQFKWTRTAEKLHRLYMRLLED